MLVRLLPDARQGFSEGQHAVVLDRVANLSPPLVIAILLSSAGVAAGRLDMPSGARADPDVGPGWWDDQALDALQRLLIPDGLPMGIQVGNRLARPPAANSRAQVRYVAEAGGTSGLSWIGELGRIDGRRRLPGLRQA